VRLNLGAGTQPHMEGWTHVDRVPLPDVDVVHDLDNTPWPWADGSVDAIIGNDIFEHMSEPVMFMTECHRILQPRGRLALKCPHWRFEDAFTDPTHKRFCTEYTWDYWIPGTVLFKRHNPAYGGVAFGLEQRRLYGGSIFISLRKAD
jgi:predicted SAM-dependent methyltransferase